MPENAPIENAAAVNKRVNEKGEDVPDNTGHHPKVWAGVVVRNWGPWVEKGKNSGQWRVEIKSKGLQETVTASVNEDRQVGEEVEFKLDDVVSSPPTFSDGPPITLGRITSSAIFKQMRNKRLDSPEKEEWKDHPEFGKGKSLGMKEPESQ